MRTIGCPASLWRAGTWPAVTLAGRRRSALLVAPTLAVAAVYLVHFGRGIGLGCYRIDLEVYRAGARVLLHGGDLYRPLELVLLALSGLAIAVAGALLPATWAARARTASALRAE